VHLKNLGFLGDLANQFLVDPEDLECLVHLKNLGFLATHPNPECHVDLEVPGVLVDPKTLEFLATPADQFLVNLECLENQRSPEDLVNPESQINLANLECPEFREHQ
jgi:hypothetical protein